MSLTIPEGANYKTFFNECISKGISIKSNYRGVTLNYWNSDKNKPCWLARYSPSGKKCIYIGRFEFSSEGEKKARLAYFRYLSVNNIQERFSVKRSGYKQNAG